MKISIWQEFSSNNSARFTIVGIFKSPEAAKTPAETVENALDRIEEWHKANPEKSEDIYTEREEVSSVEQELAAKYFIAWDQPVLWTQNFVLTTYQQLVFIKTIFGADSGAYPVDKFIDRLGAEVLVSGDILWDFVYGKVSLIIKCTAPTLKVAEQLAAELGGQHLYSSLTVQVHDERLNFQERIIEVLEKMRENLCQNIEITSTQVKNHHIRLASEPED